MIKRNFLILIFFLMFLNSCTSVVQERATSTPTERVTLPLTNTTSTGEAEIFELTISMRDDAFHTHVYAVKVGCFDSMPCPLESKKLFDMESFVEGLHWSPDGQSLAFDSMWNGSLDIFVTRDDGKAVDNITKTQGLDEGSPNWSPDGTQIAYSVQSSMEPSKILVSSPDGSNTKQILVDIFEPIQFTWSYKNFIAYSAFVSTQDGRYQIRVLNQDGSLYWLTPLDESKMGFGTANAVFSPDEKWLLYTGSWLNNDRIYLADLQAKTAQALSTYSKDCSELEPSWSPDGKWIAFISNCESDDRKQYALFLISLTLKQKTKLDIGINGYIQDAIWRPIEK